MLEADFDHLESAVKGRLANLRDSLGNNVEEGRRLLQLVFPEPLRVMPIRTPYGALFEMTGKASATAALWGAAAPEFTKVASPEGFEPSLAT